MTRLRIALIAVALVALALIVAHATRPAEQSSIVDYTRPTHDRPSRMERLDLATTTTTTTTVAKRKVLRDTRTTRQMVGGDATAILTRIMHCESGGNPTAQNRRSTASGLFQYLDSTWNNWRGYARAMFAPPDVQWERARHDYARLGTRPWTASRGCWG